MIKEGYIKFALVLTTGNSPDGGLINDINLYRTGLYDSKLIGVYDSGIGFGNISKRISDEIFVISGSSTGAKRILTNNEYSIVTKVDIDRNSAYCIGKIAASSESMTHAAIYLADCSAKFVVHIHSQILWSKYIHKLPSSDETAEYGTPEMALSITKLIQTGACADKIIIMGGHEEGILLWGASIDEIKYALANILT